MDEELDLAVITKLELEKHLGMALKEAVNTNELLSMMKNIQIFKSLTDSKLRRLITALKIR
jgi:hypothetical protein